MTLAPVLPLAIAVLSIAGVIIRPFKWPEAVWVVTGSVLIVALGMMPLSTAWHAIGEGSDVYLFLIGMMVLSEVCRREGLFEWAALQAVSHARRSPTRLFALVYGVGVVVTTFLSNDACAVVLTPAVLMAARKAEARPMPLLFACAMIANAASFVLPISNPANLVVYGSQLPPLGAWFLRFALPSAVAIVTTFALLRWSQRHELTGRCAAPSTVAPLSRAAWVAVAGLVVTAVVLMIVSALGRDLGVPTAILGVATALAASLMQRRSPLPLLRHIDWAVLPLVAGLFVMVAVFNDAGVVQSLAGQMMVAIRHGETEAAGGLGVLIAFACNLVNNLPAGLLASQVVARSQVADRVVDAILIGVDLGPNLSVTGSLATILWLNAIRREGEDVSFWRFLKVGLVVMPLSLVATLAARLAF